MRRRFLLAAGVTVLAGVGGLGASALTPEPTVADEKPPIVQQVEEHEVRIDDLESRADETDVRIEERSAGLTEVRTRVEVREVPRPNQPTPLASTLTVPVEEPKPEPHPRTITAVSDTPDPIGRNCRYTLNDLRESSRQGVITQPASVPCMKVGEVLPR